MVVERGGEGGERIERGVERGVKTRVKLDSKEKLEC